MWEASNATVWRRITVKTVNIIKSGSMCWPFGWRMISLSAHGNPSNPRYSAVWVKEPGPDYVAVHDLPISKYQKWFDDQTKNGYAPVLVTATAAGVNAVVAAVFAKGSQKGMARETWTGERFRRTIRAPLNSGAGRHGVMG